ncbi:hypothetical protein ACH5RR_029228 [Cinchona calisaya]|uniref:FBD domain-containing protein n=1 Tax=Cinchona calisaya TaxID=153742 RepID=A0ABD2YUB8_9GENT
MVSWSTKLKVATSILTFYYYETQESIPSAPGDISERDPGSVEFDLFEVNPLCLARKPRNVEIADFSGSETEFNGVEYLLQHGVMLELMSFRFSKDKRVCRRLVIFQMEEIINVPKMLEDLQDCSP